MSENQKIVQINACTLFGDLIDLTLRGLWCGYFLKFYLEIDQNLRSSYVTTFLLIEIVCSFVALGLNVIGFVVDFLLQGTTCTEKQHETARLLNSNLVKLISETAKELSLVCCVALVPTFIPYTEQNCHSYSHAICIFARIMTFFGIIYMILAGIVITFVVLYVMCTCGILCCNSSARHEIAEAYISHTQQHNTINLTINHRPIQLTRLQSVARQLNNTTGITRTIIGITPLRHIQLFDVECCVCLESGNDGNTDFVETPCGHKFHNTCLHTWSSNTSNPQHSTCPVCRQSLTTGNNVANTCIVPSAPPAPSDVPKSIDVV